MNMNSNKQLDEKAITEISVYKINAPGYFGSNYIAVAYDNGEPIWKRKLNFMSFDELMEFISLFPNIKTLDFDIIEVLIGEEPDILPYCYDYKSKENGQYNKKHSNEESKNQDNEHQDIQLVIFQKTAKGDVVVIACDSNKKPKFKHCIKNSSFSEFKEFIAKFKKICFFDIIGPYRMAPVIPDYQNLNKK